MKLVSFRLDGCTGIGVLRGEWVFDIAACAQLLPDHSVLAGVTDMLSLLERGAAAVAAAGHAADAAGRALRDLCPPFARRLDTVQLCAPVMPRKLLCLAGNYGEHIREGGGDYPGKEKMTPRVFMKPPTTTVTNPADPIVIPRNGQCIDWEIEMGLVIGKRGKFIPAEQAMDYVVGYTLVNDVSERELKVSDQREERPPWDEFFDWLNGKWLDTFAPMGPCITTKDEIADPLNLHIGLSVNGEVKQDGNTGQMIFGPAELIEFISSYVTLEPGDVIATGTCSGVGSTSGTFLKPGDVVVGELEGVGQLESPVRGE